MTAFLEAKSEHPIAKAVVEKSTDEETAQEDAEDFKPIRNKHVKVQKAQKGVHSPGPDLFQ